MNTNSNSSSEELDERINQLIVKYVCHGSDETDDTKTTSVIPKTNTSATAVSGRKASDDFYYYKIQTSRTSNEEHEERTLLQCHDMNCSNNSANTDTESSESKLTQNSHLPRSTSICFTHRHVNQQTSFTVPMKVYSEKTTYCRPVTNLHDEKFVSKVMERNVKLQKLLIKYIINRHKEKQKESHSRNSSKYYSSPSVSYKSENPKLRNHYHDAESDLHQSGSYQEILHDLYDTIDEEYPPLCGKKTHFNASLSNDSYQNRLHYIPNVLQIKGKCENRQENDGRHQPYCSNNRDIKKAIDDKNLVARKISKKNNNKHIHQVPSSSLNQVSDFKIKSTRDVQLQTNITFGGYNTENYLTNKYELKSTYDKIPAMSKDINQMETIAAKENHDTVVEPICNITNNGNITNPSIANIEVKLDTLIDLFTSFVTEFKSQKRFTENKLNSYLTLNDEKPQKTCIEGLKTRISKKKVTIAGNVMTNTSKCVIDSNLTPSHYLLNMRLDNILREELEKSNKVRSEIADILTKNYRFPVSVNVEIPTKERSTEVTASLSKTEVDSPRKGVVIEDVPRREIHPSRSDRRMAVNTEPLGFLTLLRLSSEVMKQILSFMPDVSWYLARVMRPARGMYDYVCNICGAAFERPSLLNAHVLLHESGHTRECSICRHTVNQRRRSQLFRCRYCGRMFARAYCCELHQRECPAGHGHGLEGSPSRALLQ